MLCTQCTQQNNLPQKSIGKLFSTTKKGYVEDRRSLYEIRRFQNANPALPMFRCGGHEDLMNEMFKTFSMTGLRDRSPYHKGIVAQSYSCHTKNMINKVSKHALTIPVYSPLQELCFVRLQPHHHHAGTDPSVAVSVGENFRLHTGCKHHDQTVLTISSTNPSQCSSVESKGIEKGLKRNPEKLSQTTSRQVHGNFLFLSIAYTLKHVRTCTLE